MSLRCQSDFKSSQIRVSTVNSSRHMWQAQEIVNHPEQKAVNLDSECCSNPFYLFLKRELAYFVRPNEQLV